MLSFICISLIFLAAGFIQGLSGFGSALIAMPLLSMLIDVKTAVPLCILNSLLITAYLSVKLKNYMDWKKIVPLIAGSIPGIYMGVTFLENANSEVIKLLLGLLIISYSVYCLAVTPRPSRIHPFWAYVAGFGTGFIGSAFSAGGPPAIIYTTLTGWSRDHVKATLTGFFFISSIITVIVHSASGLTNAVVVKYFFSSAVFVLAGVYAGSLLYGRVAREGYIRIVLVTLIVLGLLMTGSAMFHFAGP